MESQDLSFEYQFNKDTKKWSTLLAKKNVSYSLPEFDENNIEEFLKNLQRGFKLMKTPEKILNKYLETK